jgi:hypothetical protein
MRNEIEMRAIFDLFLKQFDTFVSFLMKDVRVDKKKLEQFVIYTIQINRGITEDEVEPSQE